MTNQENMRQKLLEFTKKRDQQRQKAKNAKNSSTIQRTGLPNKSTTNQRPSENISNKVTSGKQVTIDHISQNELSDVSSNLTLQQINSNFLSLIAKKQVIINQGETTVFPSLLLFSLDSVNMQDKETSRVIFQMLKNTDANDSVFFGAKQYHIHKRSFVSDLNFWLKWASCEEAWGDFIKALDVYYDAIEHLQNDQDLIKLKQQCILFESRLGASFCKSVSADESELEDAFDQLTLQSSAFGTEASLDKIDETMDLDSPQHTSPVNSPENTPPRQAIRQYKSSKICN